MKRTIITAVATAFLILSGCEKTPRPSKPITSKETFHSKSCDPSEDIEGYEDLFQALNEFAICDYVGCSGSSTVYFTNPQNNMLKDPSGNYYAFDPSDIITPAKQSEIMSQAAAWGTDWVNTNLSGSGYFVSAISYQPYITGLLNFSYVKVTVTLRKCTGGGGEGN